MQMPRGRACNRGGDCCIGNRRCLKNPMRTVSEEGIVASVGWPILAHAVGASAGKAAHDGMRIGRHAVPGSRRGADGRVLCVLVWCRFGVHY